MKSSVLLAAALGSFATAAWWLAPDRPSGAISYCPCHGTAPLSDSEIDERWREQRDFRHFLDTLLKSVHERRLTLIAAAEHLETYAQQQHPVYVAGLDLAVRGRSLREKVARNLIRHFEMEVMTGNPRALSASFLAELQMEFVEEFGVTGDESLEWA